MGAAGRSSSAPLLPVRCRGEWGGEQNKGASRWWSVQGLAPRGAPLPAPRRARRVVRPVPPPRCRPRGSGSAGRGRGGPGEGAGTSHRPSCPPPGSAMWRWRCEGRAPGGLVPPGANGREAARTAPHSKSLSWPESWGPLPGENVTGENEGLCLGTACLGRTSLPLAHSLRATVSLLLLQEPIGLASSVRCHSLGTPSARRRLPPGNGLLCPTCTW